MNIAKKENLDLDNAYNKIMDSIPIEFITITVFIIAFVSLLILIYIKFFHSKNISAEQKEILNNKRGIRLLVSFCITVLMLAVALILFLLVGSANTEP